MIDPIQILIIVIISILTILLVIVGVELLFILRDFRKTFTKANESLDKLDSILSDLEMISESVAQPVSKFSNLIMGVQQGAGILRFLNNMFNKSSKTSHEE